MDVRGLTLRSKTRRPQISAPKPIVDPNSGSSGNASPGTKQQQPNGGATSDLVKRRYSTRFTQLPDFSAAAADAPPIPTLPPSAEDFTRSQEQLPVKEPSLTSSSSQPLRVELHALRNPDLRVENCMGASLLRDRLVLIRV